jgi:hypothetical protein
MPEDNKGKIKKWIVQRDPMPKLYQAEVKQREFGLDIIEIKVE